MPTTKYRGRFAPSPTGDLHLGSLVAALASYLQARYHRGSWLIRIDDIDPPREVDGSAQSILDTLATLGMQPDEPVIYQSTRTMLYQNAVDQLLDAGKAYPCSCSRAALDSNGRYPGNCRDSIQQPDKPVAFRLHTAARPVSFVDGICGEQSTDINADSGDFVICRKDRLFAYQLCAAIDDAAPGITEVVRGADLLESTARQRYIQGLLSLTSPRYAHVPVLTGPDGEKLSKSLHSDPLQQQQPVAALRVALHHLQHFPDPDIQTIDGMHSWALQHWSPQRLGASWQ